VNQIADFLNNPLVAPLYAILVIGLLDVLLGVYRSIQQGVFDWNKLPSVLDATVLQKFVPLAVLGAASFFVTDQTAHNAMQVAYATGCAAALASQVASFIQKITGAYTATDATGSVVLAPGTTIASATSALPNTVTISVSSTGPLQVVAPSVSNPPAAGGAKP
jgi:uncharacterized membrane protein